jgi:hypothetical protein
MYKQHHFVLQVGILYTRAQHKKCTQVDYEKNSQQQQSGNFLLALCNLCNQLGNWAKHKKTFYIGTAASILR